MEVHAMEAPFLQHRSATEFREGAMNARTPPPWNYHGITIQRPFFIGDVFSIYI